jgi:hypothetical protein
MIGTIVSHYRIIEKLSGQGRRNFHRVEDTKLDLPVALKFLPEAPGGQALPPMFEKSEQFRKISDPPRQKRYLEVKAAPIIHRSPLGHWPIVHPNCDDSPAIVPDLFHGLAKAPAPENCFILYAIQMLCDWHGEFEP